MNTNELDKVIPVDNPLEPEKGGLFEAFLKNNAVNQIFDELRVEILRKHWEEDITQGSVPSLIPPIKEVYAWAPTIDNALKEMARQSNNELALIEKPSPVIDESFKTNFSKLERLLYQNEISLKFVGDENVLSSTPTNDVCAWYSTNSMHLSHYSDKFPKPIHYQKESDFIRDVTNCLTFEKRQDALHENKIYNDSNLKLSFQKYYGLILETTGVMLANKLDVPVTQHDINRLSRWYIDANKDDIRNSPNLDISPNKDKPLLKDAFDIAAKFTNTIAKTRAIEPLDTQSNSILWSYWVSNKTEYAKQIAPISSEISKDNVIKALNDMTSQKVNEIGQSKEPIKAALSQDQSINQVLMTKSISVPADKSKEPQTKGAER